ncbi:hypothetical protein [Haladaptatus sp. DYSN1]|uniref:hypothetical protein n=1 Tax=unclassified Haladaptatus TaxID=2622732 RepID=UPI0024063E75|nr:hypothetical protein [Haladaptatus sp. DYSN1]
MSSEKEGADTAEVGATLQKLTKAFEEMGSEVRVPSIFRIRTRERRLTRFYARINALHNTSESSIGVLAEDYAKS